MNDSRAYLALDLGAGSGRAIAGSVRDDKITLHEIHRFENIPVLLGDTLYWNFLSLFANIKQGIQLAVEAGYDVKGIAVDTWGVDFGLLDKSGNLLGMPVSYRDERTSGMLNLSEKYISKEEFYEKTGIQAMEINTAFQLLSLQEAGSPMLSAADKLLFVPDLINYFLTDVAVNEYTIASTSQLLNAKSKSWDESIFRKMSLPENITNNIVFPGATIGPLRRDVAKSTGAESAKVYAVGSHDTASAIAAIPAEGRDWAFLSSGTWSLLGVVTDEPILTESSRKNDFTNEGGVDDKFLYMRNITGLWLLQRLLAEWKEQGLNCDYEFLFTESDKCKAFTSVVNSDDPLFVFPSSMTEAIQIYCKNTGQSVPQTQGELVRCVLESLACKYYHVLNGLKDSCGRTIKRLFVVGGGSLNERLNQYIANALEIDVISGLTEATAAGNILQQAIADGQLAHWAEAHSVIKNSFEFKVFTPQGKNEWQDFISKNKHLF